MSRQFLTLGGANFTPFTGLAQPYSTNYSPANADLTSNFTGAISPVSGTGRPLAISSLTIYFRTGGGSGNFFVSNNSTGTGSVTSTSSSITSMTGTVSRVVNYPALIDATLYYGFDKTNTTQTNYSTDLETGSNVYSNGVLLNSGRAIYGQLQVDTIPSAVLSLSASTVSSTQINVSWSAPSDNGGTSVTGYRVAYKPSASSTWSYATTTGTSASLTGLIPSTTYDIKVGAKNSVTTLHNSTYGYSGVTEHTGTAADTTATTGAGLPVFTDTSLATGTQGVFYSDGVSATNTVSYSISSGSLPPGISLASNTGAITGTPTANGTYFFTVSANNAYGSTPANLSLTINPPAPVWTDQVLASPAYIDSPYSDGVSATYATSYAISAGTLPTGLSLNTSTGAVTGTPTVEDTFDFTLQASNLTGTISQGFTIQVLSGLQPPAFTDQTLSNDLRVFIAYTDAVAATNDPTYTISAGTLVPGLTLNSSTGAVTGTPTAQGEYSFTIQATNAAGNVTAPFTLNVKPGAKRYDGAAFQPLTTLKRWDGAAWVDLTFTKRWNGSTWQDMNG